MSMKSSANTRTAGQNRPSTTARIPIRRPSNILKIATITDRHGNVTEFEYDYEEEGNEPTYEYYRVTGTAEEQLT